MEIKITGLTCVQDPKPNRGGDTILAFFDCRIEWLTMEGAALVRQGSNGKLTTWEPLAREDRPNRRCMQLDGEVRWAVADAALPVYEQFA